MAESQVSWSVFHYTYDNPIRYTDPTGMMGQSFHNITTTVVNRETGEELFIDDGYDFVFEVSNEEFQEISEYCDIQCSPSAYNRWFWQAVWHKFRHADSDDPIEQLLQEFVYDDIAEEISLVYNQQYGKAALHIAAGKLKFLKGLKKWIKKNPGKKVPGTKKGGGNFDNDGRGNGEVLPRRVAKGNPIKYKEYDVNPTPKGKARDAERLVVGSDGRTYYTNDHYKTFTEIKD